MDKMGHGLMGSVVFRAIWWTLNDFSENWTMHKLIESFMFSEEAFIRELMTGNKVMENYTHWTSTILTSTGDVGELTVYGSGMLRLSLPQMQVQEVHAGT